MKVNDFLCKPYLYLLIISIGIGLKFYKLDQQFFWDDEIATVLHVSGISMNDYEATIPVNTIFQRGFYDKILALNNRDLNVTDQIHGLMLMPQLTPGQYYYLIFWIRIFGDGYMSYRYFSVLLFLLSLPMLFLLSQKLFKSTISAWIAVSIYAVSPFFQMYGQEARYYMLWSLAIVCMHYLFLVASEKQTRLWWGIYVISGVFAVHVTVMFSLIYIMHLIYYLVFYTDKWKPLFISLSLIFLSSLPWLIFIFINRSDIQQNLSWQTDAFGDSKLHEIILWQIDAFLSVFYNLYYPISSMPTIQISRLIFVILLVMSIIFLLKNGTKKQIWFVFLSTFLGSVVMISEDMIRHSITSLLPRYSLLNFVGIILLITFIGEKLLRKNIRLFSLLFMVVILAGIYSSKKVTDDLCATDRADSYYHLEDARTLFSGNERILILSDYNLMGPNAYSMFMSLIHWSKNKHIDLIYARPDYPNFATDFDLTPYDKVYGMYASDNLTKQLKDNFGGKLKLLYERDLYGMVQVPVYVISH